MLMRPSSRVAIFDPPLKRCSPRYGCRACEAHLPLGPRPVLRAGETARILVVGQAPGARVHATGIPGTTRAESACARGWA